MTAKAAPENPSLIDHSHVRALVLKEFERLGIADNPSRFTKRVDTSETSHLPEVHYTALIDPKKLDKLASVRKLGKIPTVTYLHNRTNQGKLGGSTIWRSSEPKGDILVTPCAEDKEYIQLIREVQISNEQDSQPSQNRKLNIFTARSEPLTQA